MRVNRKSFFFVSNLEISGEGLNKKTGSESRTVSYLLLTRLESDHLWSHCLVSIYIVKSSYLKQL